LIVNQTTLDKKAMIALARMSRKALGGGRSRPVRRFAWFAVVVELLLAALFFQAGAGWLTYALMAAIMLACILGEDTVNGMISLRQVLPESREVNTTFKDEHYIQRTQASETWWNYRQIRAVAENGEYFALVMDKSHGQVYDKAGFSWGDAGEFRKFIQKKTGLKVQKIR